MFRLISEKDKVAIDAIRDAIFSMNHGFEIRIGQTKPSIT